MGTYEIDLPALDHFPATNKGKHVLSEARKAQVEVRSQHLLLLPTPAAGRAPLAPAWAAKVREVTPCLPPGEEPVLWHLCTNHLAQTFGEAKEIVGFYTQRWMIEQLFRTVKSEGFALEETELESFDAIIRQIVILSCNSFMLETATTASPLSKSSAPTNKRSRVKSTNSFKELPKTG